MKTIASVVVAFLMLSLPGQPAFAASAKKQAVRTQIVHVWGIPGHFIFVPLSSGECQRLGGTVLGNPVCPTIGGANRSCKTRTIDSVTGVITMHEACIDEQ